MKAFYADPRPFWTDKQVQSIGPLCPVEFGNPSGHSWFAPIFGFAIVIDYWGTGRKYANIWISIAVVILVPISRMYLGAHSLNQVLQGLVLGLAMCLLYVIKLKEIISNFLKEFYQRNLWKVAIIVGHIMYIIPFIAHRKEELPV
jgi:membrane-associated phospholipid phosphatase